MPFRINSVDILYMKKKLWSIADLVDLEFFFRQDDGRELDSLAARDRKIYTELPSALRGAEAVPSVLLRAWLCSRRKSLRKEAGESVLPGRVWQEVICFFYGTALLVGLFSGIGLAFSFLAYSGREPVNVAAYFAVFVLVQALLFFLLVGTACFRKIQGRDLVEASLLYRLLRRLFAELLHKLTASMYRKASHKISAETRLKWSSSAAGIRQLRQRYGPLFFRPFFLVVQTFGVSFNIGVLAATLFKVIGADLAFGWQSTLQVTPASVQELVHWIALPWSLLPDPFIPTLSQIEGSRLLLKEGIYHLVNADLTSWWPFLCLSVFCYGLLPRLLLLLIVSIRQHRNLTELDFQQGYFRQTLHRMLTPQVSTAAREKGKSSVTGAEPASASSDESTVPELRHRMPQQENSSLEHSAPNSPSAPLIVLIPDELLPDCPAEELARQVSIRLGYILTQTFPFWTLEQSEEEELVAVQKAGKEQKRTDVLVLLEAWQPPIQELFSWLGLLRRTLGPEPVIILALIGKPTSESILTPVQQQDMRIWQQKSAALNDPGLQLIELIKE